MEHKKKGQKFTGAQEVLNRQDEVDLAEKVTSEHRHKEGRGSKLNGCPGEECSRRREQLKQRP